MKRYMFALILFSIGSLVGVVIFFVIDMPQSNNQLISPWSNDTSIPNTAFSMTEAPYQSLRGTITTLSGDIWWKNRVATEPQKLLSLIPIQQGETFIASDTGTLTIDFANRASLVLSPQSEVDIVQTLPVNIVFQQHKGTITYSSLGSSPVSIRSYRLLTTLNTGKTQIDVDDETHTVTLTVTDGTATIAYNNPKLESQVIELKKGDIFLFDSDNRTGSLR